jgi:5-methylphenazine-1-carboxylate 1-monooxygenase
MKILIVGGRIGGLIAALSLHNEGFDVHAFESVEEIKPLGVGIHLLPTAYGGAHARKPARKN